MFWKNPICLFTVRFMLRLNNMMVLGIKEKSMTKTLFSNYESWKTGVGSRLNHSEKTHRNQWDFSSPGFQKSI